MKEKNKNQENYYRPLINNKKKKIIQHFIRVQSWVYLTTTIDSNNFQLSILYVQFSKPPYDKENLKFFVSTYYPAPWKDPVWISRRSGPCRHTQKCAIELLPIESQCAFMLTNFLFAMIMFSVKFDE